MPRSQTGQGSGQAIVRGGLAALAVVAALASGSSAYAQAADDIAAGRQLFLQKGNCQACHGWAGDGRKMDSQMPDGANLRASKMDRATLIMTIKCGIPGTGMPPFDKLAYSDGRCFGMKQADLKERGIRMADPPATLQPREVELLTDFLLARIVRQGPMDHDKCVVFWGKEVDACNEL